tara:strand:- start:1321 stop:1770 length:450 start_codon:yes stop_codon:yes gene_type:complete
MKEYVVQLNSRVALTGANNGNQTYAFDFSNFEQGAYMVDFTYHGEANNLARTNTCSIFTNFNSPYVMTAGATSGAQTSAYFGTLTETSSTTVGCFTSNHLDNPPIHLSGRPTNPIIEIQMRDGNNALYTDNAGGELANYIMAIRFRRCD